MPPGLTARASAKVNLTLAVRARRADGYHDLESLVVFAAAGDALRFVPGGAGFSLVTRGRTAGEAGPVTDNLVLKAARLLAERVPGLPGGAFTLIKRLPVAAGLGGGSSDAAAALRLLANAAGLSLDDPRLMEAARLTGSDVPVCLAPAARFMRGTGHDLGPILALPRLPALLVNPRVAVPTPAVFGGLGLAPGATRGGDPAVVVEDGSRRDRRALLPLLAASRNDLETRALALAPVIGEALALLRGDPACRLARMSGSGATVFGLYDTCRAAAAAGKAITAVRPHWWVKPTMLG
ncbi:4-(cytidine 5'-diphospho)-2-C-methyl-D-erythritol kinase [Phreatobacter cathodiphilus]|uniref:4-diphosphocytidyl-2-C-methyl-D-erythritol kinase n=1 Tax=Phreatobacter cathodiphilus TaxID=1868589 RepID=A0A2S0NBV1_9HYPH|nr:4-(cytidine 5'-diphospho)-2-C-methyl-D-erythritol kinase [Phreatobacter cathodiphilus]AVO45615.1 4-(cytidine 5'-diphospho)-2-C-methyl-D-erythritol kinase [Phreatobacter cathodiphilus]